MFGFKNEVIANRSEPENSVKLVYLLSYSKAKVTSVIKIIGLVFLKYL